MADWDDLERDARSVSKKAGPQCGTKTMLEWITENHGPNATYSVVRTLANTRLTTTSIRKALESRVYAEELPSTYSLHRHRTGRCSCDQGAS